MMQYKQHLKTARTIAQSATCPKKQVGCVIVDKLNVVLSYGYNQVPQGCLSCISTPCSDGLSNCHAIHAEANALLLCKDVMDIHTIYVTLSPCFDCAKLICHTSCKRVVYLENYKKNNGIELLLKYGIEVIQYENI